MSSRSWPRELWAWTTTRLLLPRVGVLWLLLMGVSHHTSEAALLVTLLIAQFRLWDDLADRRHDGHHHPQRVLVTSVHGGYFGMLCVAAAAPVLLLLWGAPVEVAVYVLLCLGIASVYSADAALPRLLRAQLVLLKYAVFAWLAGASVALGLGLWLALAVYEMYSDATLQTSRCWRALAGAQILGLLVLASIFTIS
ncbi:MAG: hypothetical protein ACJ8GW_14445 [Massilia sp.]